MLWFLVAEAVHDGPHCFLAVRTDTLRCVFHEFLRKLCVVITLVRYRLLAHLDHRHSIFNHHLVVICGRFGPD